MCQPRLCLAALASHWMYAVSQQRSLVAFRLQLARKPFEGAFELLSVLSGDLLPEPLKLRVQPSPLKKRGNVKRFGSPTTAGPIKSKRRFEGSVAGTPEWVKLFIR